MARRIHLTWSISRYVANAIHGIRLRLVADESEEMPMHVFAYIMEPLNSATQAQRAQFDHVCSPPDLEDYPIGSPLVGHVPPFFRLNYVDVLLRSEQEVQDLLASIQADVRALKRTLDIMDTLLPGGTVWIDDEPPASESDSISISDTEPA